MLMSHTSAATATATSENAVILWLINQPKDLVVIFHDTAETDLEAFVEALAEDAEHCHHGTYRGDGQLHRMSYAIPAEHHEGDRGGQECEGDQRGKIECEATLGLTYDSLGGRSVGFAHALLERRVVAVGFQEHGAESRDSVRALSAEIPMEIAIVRPN